MPDRYDPLNACYPKFQELRESDVECTGRKLPKEAQITTILDSLNMVAKDRSFFNL